MIDSKKSEELFNSLNEIFISKSNNDGYIKIDQLYKLIQADINLLLDLYKPYLKHVLEYPKGQINLESEFGRDIHKLLKSDNLSLLEFGCWNGLGSTKLAAESTSAPVISIELNPFMISTTVKNLQPFPRNLNVIWGKILEVDNFSINLKESFFADEFKNPNVYLGALIEVILLNSAPNVIKLLPEKIDCILLDGGGFMTFEEFLILKDRAEKYLFLDDINSVKCLKIYTVLSNSKGWSLKSRYDDRNSAIFMRDDK